MPNMDAVTLENQYCLFKGEPGTRKSACALSYPGPQYWFSFDRKMNGLWIPKRNWGLKSSHITYDDYMDWNPALKKLEGLRVNNPYKTIIIDSITSCADAINRQTLRLKTGTSTRAGEDKGKTIAGIPVNSIEDFNAEESALKELVSLTKDIAGYHGCNIILIAHVIQKDIKNASGQVTHVSRTIVTAGKGIAAKIPAYCPEVYHFNIKGGGFGSGNYSLLTRHTGDDFARSSLDLESEIVFNDEPLYPNFIKPVIDKMIADEETKRAKEQAESTTTTKNVTPFTK
jgi:hypothetical protein